MQRWSLTACTCISPSSISILVSPVRLFYCQIGWELINRVNANRCTSSDQTLTAAGNQKTKLRFISADRSTQSSCSVEMDTLKHLLLLFAHHTKRQHTPHAIASSIAFLYVYIRLLAEWPVKSFWVMTVRSKLITVSVVSMNHEVSLYRLSVRRNFVIWVRTIHHVHLHRFILIRQEHSNDQDTFEIKKIYIYTNCTQTYIQLI